MSVARTRFGTIRYGGLIDMIPWYRQVIAMLFGIGIIMLGLWIIDHGSDNFLILGLGVLSICSLTVMLIFGVEMQRIELELANGWLKLTIPFEETSGRTTFIDNGDDDESSD